MSNTTYRSNNSGGYWHVSDEEWKALDAHLKWTVEWATSDELTHRIALRLGALATMATYRGNSVEEAKESFSEITGLDPEFEGCDCCGPPHNFYTEL